MAYTTYPTGNSSALPVNSSSVIIDGELITTGAQTEFISIPAGIYYGYASSAGNIQIGSRTYPISANELTSINYPRAEGTASFTTFANTPNTTFITTSIPSAVWWGITYGNGIFLATGTSSSATFNLYATSTDGIDWVQRTSANLTSGNHYRTTYGNGKFVLARQGSTTAFYSTDALSWTITTMPAVSNWFSGSYGNGVHIATSISNANNVIAYSQDGISWIRGTLPITGTWYSSSYGNGTFIAVSNTSGVNAVSSTDGATWTQRTLPATATWYVTAYGNNTFVATTSNVASTTAASSTDGITWALRTLPAAGTWNGLAYGNGIFMAASNGNTTAATSTDGITWTLRTLPASAGVVAMSYGNGSFFNLVQSSTTGMIATTTTPATPISFGLYAGPKDVY